MPATRNLEQLVHAKNAVRGAIGNNEPSLMNVVAREFETLDPESIRDFYSWLSGYPAKEYSFVPPAKIEKYEGLSFELSAPWTELQSAITWTIAFLSAGDSILNRFVALSTEFETCWLSDDLTSALATLNKIESEIGLSVWLIQTKLAFLQFTQGLDAQKKYARTIHESAPRSLAASIGFYCSVRNEETVSLARFRQLMEKKIGGAGAARNRQNFIRIQLSGASLSALPTDEMAAYLGVCAGLSLVDGYEGLLDCLQAILAIAPRAELVEIIQALAIDDCRLRKLAAVASGDFGGLPARSWQAEDWYITGDPYCSAIALSDIAKQNPTDLDAIFWCANAYAMAGEFPEKNALPSLQLSFLNWCIALRRRGEDLEANLFNATKSLLNLRTLRSAKAVHGFLCSEILPKTVPTAFKTAAQFWHTSSLHPAQATELPAASAAKLLNECRRRQPGSLLVSIFCQELLDIDSNVAAVQQEILLEIRAICRLRRDDVNAALAAAKTLSETAVIPFSRRAAQLEIDCLVRACNSDEAIQRAVHFCCAQDELRFLLPWQDLLPEGRWRDLQHLRREISLPIAVDFAMRTLGESATYASIRRIAYDEFLRAHDVDRPSDLMQYVTAFPVNQLVYFLFKICIPEVMDVSFLTFKSSRDLQNERSKVFALLSLVDPKNSAYYSEQVKEITRAISLQEGLHDVDRSRVHVNMNALAAWANAELRESFQRYKVLARLESRASNDDGLAAVLAEASDGQASDKYLVYPTQEGDTLLFEIFQTIKNEYLLNPDFGLDAYLSMRVRHGSLAGHLRGPLEECHLLISKERAAKIMEKQADNIDLQQVSMSIKQMLAVEKAINDFSETYDAIIDDIAKNRLQVRRAEKPNGLFSMETPSLVVYWIRSRIRFETDFLPFLDAVLMAIESMRDRDLVQVREYLTVEIKSRVELAFDDFRQSLEAALSANQYNLANSVIASALPAVQAAIDRVVDWFAVDQAQRIMPVRSVGQIVDIALEASKNARRGFNPEINRQIEDFGYLTEGALLDFTDIFFTILDNVYRHSEMGETPRITIIVNCSEGPDITRKVVRIRVESEIAPEVYNPTTVAKLERIRVAMNTDAYRKLVNFEGGTGMLKLKRLVAQGPQQTLDFGFDGEKQFFVELHLILQFHKLQIQ